MSEREPISGSSRDYGSTAAPPTVGFADFSPTELYNLSEGIADNINAINSGLRSLEKMMKQIGGPNDSVQLRDKIHDVQQNVNGSVSATARDIQRLGVIVRRGDKPQKLQVERLTQAFRDALEKYSTVQKQVSEKMAAYMPSKPRMRNDPRLLEQQAVADDEEAALLANQQAQDKKAESPKPTAPLTMEIDPHLRQLQEQAKMFSRFNSQPGSDNEAEKPPEKEPHTVESHIEAAGASVEAGVDELAKAAEYQRRYRRKMFIFITIGLIIGILLIVWIIKAFR
ncbi:t-SNARE domain-containing protein 1 [Papilio machaon]|uniref:t-SNARE domain-containing protein 1 n=1 Tax=Papilio machaon TaxID=76193 RepID=A0A194QZ32_PAPMA|nr:t-SNARE domain-containing protein 1 [Papilio machaon]